MSEKLVRRIIFAAITSAAIATVLVAVAVVAFGEGFAVPGDTLTPLIAWGTWFTALGTGLLVVGAGLAALRIGEQMAQSERQHTEQIAALLTPFVAVSDAVWDGEQVRATIRNVGPGVAVGVRVAGSVVVIDQTAPLRDDELVEAVRDAERDGATPHFVGRPGALGPGDRSEGFPFHAEGRAEVSIPPTAQTFFRWEAECTDVFEKSHVTGGAVLLNIPGRTRQDA